ncbi:MAG TPA: membrane protein insertion efficiency factor YidD [Verrucomicrobiae bacterium]|nr:membrane protein insertion efficiency factor YidD [Verrucomicrobiae bacterium]
MNPVQHILVFAIRVYRCGLSPIKTALLGASARCRYTPSCSAYGLEAIQRHGAISGSWLALKRVCRCHPWGGCGHDPVPETRLNVPDFKLPVRPGDSTEERFEHPAFGAVGRRDR